MRRSPPGIATCAAPRLACVKPVASVHPEPGSNSPFKRRESLPAEVRSWFRPSPAPRLEGARSGRVSVRKNRLLGFSLLRCSVSGFQGSAAPLPGPRRFRFHPKRKEIYYASVAPPSRTFFEILGLFFPAPSGAGGPRGPAAALPLSRGEGSPSMLPASGPGRKGAFSKSSEKLAQNGPGREGVRREEGASPCRRHAPEGVRAPSGRRCRDRPVLGRDDRPHSLIYSKAGRPMVAPPSELWLTLHGYRKPQLTSCRPCHRRHRP